MLRHARPKSQSPTEVLPTVRNSKSNTELPTTLSRGMVNVSKIEMLKREVECHGRQETALQKEFSMLVHPDQGITKGARVKIEKSVK